MFTRLLSNARRGPQLNRLIAQPKPFVVPIAKWSTLRHSSNDSHGAASPSNSNGGSSCSTQEPSQTLKFSMEPRMEITYTCTAPSCSTRSSHTFTRRAYEKGIVLTKCPSCKNWHLIADNLGWFKDATDDGKMKNVEDIMRAKGEKVKRTLENGVLEALE